MRSRLSRLIALAAIGSVAACSDSNLITPAADELDSGPSAAIVDAGNQGPLDGFWFLPPLAKQVKTEGILDPGLSPRMDVCELTGNPSAEANPDGWESVVCDTNNRGEIIVESFAARDVSVTPGAAYQFSWDTDKTGKMVADKFYRIRIFLPNSNVTPENPGDEILAGYLDVNPQNPSGQTPGEDYPDLYAFRLGETLPVKFFLTAQVRCTTEASEEYVIQCAASGVIDADGGVVTLDEFVFEEDQTLRTTISTVVPPGALPPGYETVVLTMERIDRQKFFDDEGYYCIPGLGSDGTFDAPLFGLDCLRVTTDPVLPVELETNAFIDLCVEFNPTDYPTLKFGEEQDTRLQIIRYNEQEGTQGLRNVDATTCPAPDGSTAQGFFPVPSEDGFFRTAALAANTVAGFFAPTPLAAHGSIKLSGSTSGFSIFDWGLPGEMIKEAGDNVTIQTLPTGTDYDVNVTVRVQDAGTVAGGEAAGGLDAEPDGLDPSNVQGATVNFGGNSTPTEVVTGADGTASSTWTVPSTPGVHTMDATAIGLLSSAVPNHTNEIDFVQESVTFTATVVGEPTSATVSPPTNSLLEGTPGETLTQPFTLTFTDVNGLPVEGYPVTWTAICDALEQTECDGFVSNDTDGDPSNDDGSNLTTDASGQVTGYWTLANTPATNTLTVTAGTASYTWTAFAGCKVTVDGEVGLGEWDCAVDSGDTIQFLANISGGDAPAEVRWQKDAENLYFLVLIEQSALDKVNSLRIDFDNTGDGPSADDDAIGYDNTDGVFDEYLTQKCVNRSQSGCGSPDSDTDTDGPDVVIGGGSPQNDGTYTIYELSHPLNGTEGEDIRVEDLLEGEDVGFYLSLSIGNGAQGNTQIPGFRVFRPMGLN